VFITEDIMYYFQGLEHTFKQGMVLTDTDDNMATVNTIPIVLSHFYSVTISVS
jgi:hypothetical protein